MKSILNLPTLCAAIKAHAAIEAHASSEAILTPNIKYSSVMTHIKIIKFTEGLLPESLKITATTTVLRANTIYLGRTS